jgi:hypothetical protein
MKIQTAKSKQQTANDQPNRSWRSVLELHPFGFLLFGFCCWVFTWGSFCTLAQDSGAIRVRIHSIQADLGSSEIAVVLADESRDRFLPISVGGDQALSIQLGRQGLPAKRPLTHDLIASMLKALNAQVERVTITDLKESVYYAEIVLRQNGRTHRIDARPSDAIALSLRVDAPIYAMPNLLHKVEDLKSPEEMTGNSEVTGWGITVQPLTESLAHFFGRNEGVLVSDVKDEGLAAKSGIRPGDILIGVDQKKLHDVEDLLKWLDAMEEIRSVEVEVIRGNQDLKITLEAN